MHDIPLIVMGFCFGFLAYPAIEWFGLYIEMKKIGKKKTEECLKKKKNKRSNRL